MKRLVAVAVLVSLVIAAAAVAQDHPNVARGFASESVYQFSDIDNINVFNGNLIVSIPIGQTYRVGGNLSYGLHLVYNGQVWNYRSDSFASHAVPMRQTNVALGWQLTLGQLIAPEHRIHDLVDPEHRWSYIAPDGSRRVFYKVLHKEEAGLFDFDAQYAEQQSVLGYSRDGSYMRLVAGVGGAYGTGSACEVARVIVETGEGTRHTFRSQCIPSGRDHTNVLYFLEKIEDRFQNRVSIAYGPDDSHPETATEWIITDNAGATPRTHRVSLRNEAFNEFPQDGSTEERYHVTGVKVAAFGGETAEYVFHTAYKPMSEPCKSGLAIDATRRTQARVLTSVSLPDHSTYELDYEYGDGGTTCSDIAGHLKEMTLPTGGRVEYTVGGRAFPQFIGRPYDPEAPERTQGKKEWVNPYYGSVAVTERRLYADGGTSNPAVWTYRSCMQNRPENPAPHNPPKPRELVVAVDDPTGTSTRSYFTIDLLVENDDDYPDSELREYALPFTRSTLDPAKDAPAGEPGYWLLSTEVLESKCAVTSTDTPLCDVNTACDDKVMKRTYVRYDLDHPTPDALPQTDGGYTDLNRRPAGTLTVTRTKAGGAWVDDTGCGGTCYTMSELSNFDGLGHYRGETLFSNIGGAGSRTKTTNFHRPGRTAAAYDPDATTNVPSQYMIKASEPWLPAFFDTTSVKVGSGAEQTLSKVCLDETTGFLEAKRTYRGSGYHDLLAVFTQVRGNVTSESYFGGEAAPPDGCAASGTPAYRIDHQWSHGTRSKSTYLGADFSTLELTVDPNTGLASESYDTARLLTTFTYDALGRVKEIEPPNAARSLFEYDTPARPAHVSAKQFSLAGAVLTESHYYYDGFGRIVQEKRRMPGGWATTGHEYDAAGRKRTQSVPQFFGNELYSSGFTAPKTLFTLDALGRNTATTAPDGSVTATAYTGARLIERTATKGSTVASKVLEGYDGFGRLASVTEYLGTGNAPATTYYGYDFADRLLSVASDLTAAPEQKRSFTYDLAGMLTSEDHPEMDLTTYTYDARAHMKSKTVGGATLSFAYDAAERPKGITDAAGELKFFEYGPSSDALRRGRLIRQVRHNRRPAEGGTRGLFTVARDHVVTDTFLYDDAGRVGSKTTTIVSSDGNDATTDPSTSFTQSYAYTDLGHPASLQYPTCSTCTSLANQTRSIPLGYKDGLLASIAGVTAPIPAAQDLPRRDSEPFDIAYSAAGAVEAVQHASASGTGVFDRYVQDDSGLPRPKQIRFTGAPDCALITAQATDRTINSGQTATFTLAVASGATVQWYQGMRGDTATPVGTGTTFTTPALTATRTYWARVSAAGSSCVADSATVSASLCTPPVIVTPAEAATVARELVKNTPVTLSAFASGSSVSYTWYRSDVPTPVSTSDTYVFEHGVVSDTVISVKVVVTGACAGNPVERVVAMYRIVEPAGACAVSWMFDLPSIVKVIPGETMMLEGMLNRLEGATSYSFQWARDGVDEPVITVPQPSDPNALIRSSRAFNVVSGSIVKLQAWATCGTKVSERLTSQTFGLVYGECPQPAVIVDQQSIVASSTQTTVKFIAHSEWPDVRFDWYRGESGNTRFPISSGMSNTLTVPATAGTYWVRIVTECGSTDDSETLTVATPSCTPVRLRQEAQSAQIAAGTWHTLSVDASAGEWLAYQWFVDGQPAAGATSASYPVRPVKTTSYWVEVKAGSCHTAVSRIATVHVTSCADVTIAQQPQAKQISEGETATLTIQATAAAPLRYQWFKGESGDVSAPIAGATSSSVTLVGAQTARYWVRLSFDDAQKCAVDSVAVTVDVCRKPVKLSQSFSTSSSRPGIQHTLSAEASGDALTYAWYAGTFGNTAASTKLTGALSLIRVRPNVTTTYWARVTSDCLGRPDQTLDIGPIVISVCPEVLTQPQPATVMPGTSAVLSVGGDRIDRVEWYRGNSGDLSSGIVGTGTSFTTPAVSANTSFWARVYGGSCFRNSSAALVSICSQPNVSWAASNKKQVASGELQLLHISVLPNTGVYRTFYEGVAGDVANSRVLLGPGNDGGVWVNPTATTRYWVRAKMVDGVCYDDTDTLTVEVCVPTITTEPQPVLLDKVTNPSATTTLSVAANGGTLTYQWYEGASGDTTKPVAGATATTLTVSPAAQTSYWVKVTGTCATRNSQAATVTLCAKPTITQQPVSTTVTKNASHTLSVTASGTELHYQWYRGAAGDVTTPVGTDSAIHTTTFAATTDHWVRVSGRCGAAVNSSTVRISVAPTISTQPASVSITKGTTATFTVAAAGSYLTYQWYLGSGAASPVAGATSASYTTAALNADASYWCRVTSGGAFTDSALATAGICQPRTMTATPSTQVSGSQVTLSISGGAQANESYQWYAGESGNTTTLAGTGAGLYVHPLQTTKYWLRTVRASCTADSPSVTATVCYPAITSEPQGAMINQGGSKVLTVAATGTGPLTYQWYTGASGTTTNPISGATAASYTAAPAADTTYWVQVRSAAGSGCVANSAATVVSVCKPASITQEPLSTTVTKGSTHTLSVTATGTSLSYQWYAGTSGTTTTPVCGNASTCAVAVNSTADYWVRVTGASCGAADDSATAKLSVAPSITTQPASVSVTSGTTATFTIAATGTQLSYQWYLGSGSTSPISGATGTSYTTPALTADAGYWCKVTSGGAFTNSSVATATVCGARSANVAYTTQESGSQVTLSVSGGGVAGETYDWYRGNRGDTSNRVGGGASLWVFPTETTTYWLRTTYPAGCTGASQAVTATVCRPKITTQPASQTYTAGGPAVTLSAAATGTPPLTYQWYTGASGTTTSPVANGTGSSLAVSPTSTTQYWVQVRSSASCATNSDTATVSVCQPVAIAQHPIGGNVTYNAPATLSVTATGDVVRYEWYEGASGVTTTPLGATGNTLGITATATKSYWVRVIAACGTHKDSTAALVSVYPRINTQPADDTTCANQPVTFSVSASGNLLTYQWYLGSLYDRTQPIGNGTSSVSISPAAATTVWCELTSGTATTVTRAAAATVTPGPTVLAPSKTLNGSCYTLTARVSASDAGLVTYAWYRGALGDTSNFLTITKTTTVCPSTSTTYWVRVTYSDSGCHSDRAVVVP